MQYEFSQIENPNKDSLHTLPGIQGAQIEQDFLLNF